MPHARAKTPAKSAVPEIPAAVYVRMSQDRNGDELGVRRQREDCLRLAKRLGWTVAEVFVDNDVSAYSGKRRPEYERMLEWIGAGKVGALVAWHPDRLHRSPKELEAFIDLVEAHRVQIATVTAGELDLSSPTGRLTARVVGAVARNESEHKSERIRRQREQAASEGRVAGGRRGYGYTSKMELIPSEAAVVREAVAAYLGGKSVHAIANDLNARGVPNARGGLWTAQGLRAVLIAPRLCGLRVFREEVIGDGGWTPIIDRTAHEQIRARLGKPGKKLGGRPPRALLTSILHCELCGRPMRRGQNAAGNWRYTCDAGPGRGGCGRLSIIGAETDEWITAAVLEWFDQPALGRLIDRHARRDPDGAEAVVALADIDARLAELAELYGTRQLRKAEWLTARGSLERARAEAEATLRALDDDQTRSQLIPYRKPGALRRAWESMTVDDRRRIIAAVMPKIVVGPIEPSAPRRFDPDRLHVEWADLATR